jgi:methenyltetrahydrofolate cyclohydrolase
MNAGSTMKDQTIGGWLEDLGSAKPAPGGGAAAALLVATGAALVEMVTNLTIGKPRYAEHEAVMVQARDEATSLRDAAQTLAAEDEDAFNEVIATYRIGKDDPGRSAAIQAATANAAEPPLRTAELAAQVVALAGRIQPGANVNVLSDVAVAASAAKAALESAAVNVEVNLAALRDEQIVAALRKRLAVQIEATIEAEQIISTVRAGLAR